MHTVLKLAQLRWTGHDKRMPDEQLPKKVFYKELEKESALKVARRNATKTPSKPTYQVVLGNRLHRSDQSGEVSSRKEQLSVKKRESVKLKESAEIA